MEPGAGAASGASAGKGAFAIPQIRMGWTMAPLNSFKAFPPHKNAFPGVDFQEETIPQGPDGCFPWVPRFLQKKKWK
jgi:hypothetical protein